MTIITNPFVTRQTEGSRFSHFDGVWEELEVLVEQNLSKATQGYRAGILHVPVPSDRFYSGIVELKQGDKLVGGFESRVQGEEPRKWVSCVGATKMAAKSVTVILYASSVLAESGDNTLEPIEGNYEIISVNASPCESGSEPMPPETLMANYFGESGGTDTKMTPEQFVYALEESRTFWKNKAMCGGM